MRILGVQIGKGTQEVLPPPRSPDPDIVDGAIRTTRTLSRADVVLERRKRLNLELAKAEEQIRRAK